ncbi:hypothetical protein [Alistipes putredinis]|uniref:hypothetical protein n=3 Tax=Alistipes putredinis TaxID=28117 RepID=UPI003A8719F1
MSDNNRSVDSEQSRNLRLRQPYAVALHADFQTGLAVGRPVNDDLPSVHTNKYNKKSIRQPGIHTIIDPEQIFFHLTGASCPNSVEQTRNPGRTTGTNTAKGALHRHLSPSRIESNGYWHLSAICSIQRAFATTAAWPPEILLIN